MKKYMNTQVISSGEVHIEEAKLHCILMGGDLLTAMRGRSDSKFVQMDVMQPLVLRECNHLL